MVWKKEASKGRIVAIIPAYRAEKWIGSVVKGARRHANAVVVVDDGSPDKTGHFARQKGAIVISHPKNLGKSEALFTGISHVKRKLKPDYIVLLDADGQHNPAEIPNLISPLEDGIADICIGSRMPSAKRNGMPPHRRLANKFSTAITSILTGTRITDVPSGYRSFNKKAVRRLSFRSAQYEIELSTVLEAVARNLRISEVPIETIYRDEKSHIRPAKLIIGTGRLWLKWIFSKKSFLPRKKAGKKN